MQLYHKGLNFTQIALMLGCARNTVRAKVRDYVHKTGTVVPVRTKPGLSFRNITQVLEWYNAGKKVADIAETFGVTISCIYKILQKYRG